MNKLLRVFISDKVLICIKKIYPKWEVQSRIREYYMSKILYSIRIVFVGILISVLASVFNNKNELDDYLRIRRNEYGEGNKDITLNYKLDGTDVAGNIDISVSDKRYDEDEVIAMSDMLKDSLVGIILGDNTSQEFVINDLVFKKHIEGYPFDITYKTDNPLIINHNGKVNIGQLDENFYMGDRESYDGEKEQKELGDSAFEGEGLGGVNVCITATISYFDYSEDYSFYVTVHKPNPNREEIIKNVIDKEINMAEKSTLTSNYLTLPKYILGRRIEYYEESDKTNISIAILFSVAAVVMLFMKDKDLEKEVIERERCIINEYPRFIKKFTLFYNAGMPVKTIWIKMCDDYLERKSSEDRKNGKDKNYLYEEMVITKLQMMDGVREIDAYERFASRIGIKEYRVFISLIEQAVKMGKKDLVEALERECEDAFLNKKNNAKKLLEEASTKLLIPMFIMLTVVIVIVLFPAFNSFNI